MAKSLKDLVAEGSAVAEPVRSLKDMVAAGEAQAEELSPLEVNPVSGSVMRGMRGATFGLFEKANAGMDAVGDKIFGLPGTLGERYDANLEHGRTVADANTAANPRLMTAAEVLGAVAAPIPGGAAAKGLPHAARVAHGVVQGAGVGALYGYGTSRAKDWAGTAADTSAGAFVGGLAGGVGEGVIAPAVGWVGQKVSPVWDYMRKKANAGIAKAREMAGARAATEKGSELASLAGEVGAQTQKGSRLTENIRRIPGEAAQATPEANAGLLRDAARMARQRAEDLADEARAAGVEAGVPDKIGEFLTRGSKFDSGQKASHKAAEYIRGAQRLEEQAAAVLRGEVAPEAMNESLRMAREIAMESPTFRSLEGDILQSNLRALPEQAAKMRAARAAMETASEALPGAVRQRTDELLSGKAAAQRGKELLLRYGLPVFGASVGQQLGEDFGPLGRIAGAAVGWKVGGAPQAIGALAGAGLRPAAQALYRTATQYPAVQNAWWGTVKKLVSSNPQSLGKYAPALTSAAARGENALAAASFVLSQTDEAFRKMLSDAEQGQDPVASGH